MSCNGVEIGHCGQEGKPGFAICMGRLLFQSLMRQHRVIGRSRRSGFTAAAGDPRRGWLTAGRLDDPGGAWARRHPGKQARGRWRHPAGQFPSAAIVVAGRPPQPAADLSAGPAHRPKDAWCEDPDDRHYNQPIRLDREQAGDRLTREDHLYDFIVEIDHNTAPVSPAAAVRCSCIWRAPISARPRAASR